MDRDSLASIRNRHVLLKLQLGISRPPDGAPEQTKNFKILTCKPIADNSEKIPIPMELFQA